MKGNITRHLENPVLKDSVQVQGDGYTIIRFLADNPGWWFFHCHKIFHVAVSCCKVVVNIFFFIFFTIIFNLVFSFDSFLFVPFSFLFISFFFYFYPSPSFLFFFFLLFLGLLLLASSSFSFFLHHFFFFMLFFP